MVFYLISIGNLSTGQSHNTLVVDLVTWPDRKNAKLPRELQIIRAYLANTSLALTKNFPKTDFYGLLLKYFGLNTEYSILVN